MMSMAHFRRASEWISAILGGGSWPITRCNGFSTNSETTLSPRIGANAATLAMRMARTRGEESL